MELMSRLICEKESRLCSKRYQLHDQGLQASPGSRLTRHAHHDFLGRSVYARDAEDIKAHRWFRDIPWDRLHLIPPPFVPQITSLEDTHYFDEEEPISDWSESQPDTDTDIENEGSTSLPDGMALDPNPLYATAAGMIAVPPAPMAPRTPSTLAAHHSSRKIAEMHATLASYPKNLRIAMSQFVATPYDSMRLKRIYREIEHMSPDQNEVEKLKAFVRNYGKRERKRPRDRLLRDRQTKGIVLEIRKQSAFLGYTWTRMKGRDFEMGMLGAMVTDENEAARGNEGSATVAAHRFKYGEVVEGF